MASPSSACGRQSGQEIPGEVTALFEKHGWAITGGVTRNTITLPPEGPKESAQRIDNIPWIWHLEHSKAVGLDFRPYAGQDLTALGFDLKDGTGRGLPGKRLTGTALLHEKDGMVGAWVCAPESPGDEIKPGEFRCYTLTGLSLR